MMKELIVDNIETVFIVIGFVVMVVCMHLLKALDGTKYEVTAQYYILFLMAVGTISAWSALGKWIMK